MSQWTYDAKVVVRLTPHTPSGDGSVVEPHTAVFTTSFRTSTPMTNEQQRDHATKLAKLKYLDQYLVEVLDQVVVLKHVTPKRTNIIIF